ncbi:hypothetical protein ACPW96_21560 [Micromonospora sp. DT81.3]|uniref:hypothetical protein n=1 Tax=Micromonospora sp. DT81.3 TaxID=3416523 RepID=UPI003CEFCC23
MDAPTPAAGPAPRRTAAQRPLTSIKHGTVHGFNIGCKSIDTCPNHAGGEPTCTEEHRRYYREYFAAIRNSTREISHGTETGYSYGCRDRASCPGGEDGLSCPDAARAAERRRRTTRTIQAAA